MKNKTRTRTTHSGRSLTYAAAGASQADDLMLYPPKGFRPAEDRVRLGSGNQRFEAAATSLMSWGVQRGSGIRVENINLAASSDTDYSGLIYDEEGNPVAAREIDEGYTYLEDGTPFITSGTSADLLVTVAGVRFTAPVRVVRVITEAKRVGFAYGTLPGHPECGEESFIVEQHPDGSVWLIVRRFSKPGTWYSALGAPLLRWQQRRFTKRYLQALLPGRAQ